MALYESNSGVAVSTAAGGRSYTFTVTRRDSQRHGLSGPWSTVNLNTGSVTGTLAAAMLLHLPGLRPVTVLARFEPGLRVRLHQQDREYTFCIYLA